MLLFIWKGLGFLLIPVLLVSNLLGMAVASTLGADVSDSGLAYAWASLALAAVLTFLLEKFYLAPRRAKRNQGPANLPANVRVTGTHEDALFFIKVRYWPYVFIALSVIFGIAKVATDS